MPCCQQVGADLLRSNKELIKLQVIVAETTRNWRTAGEIFINKRAHYISLEALLVVHNVIRNPKMLGYMASVVNVLDGAASPLHLLRHSLPPGESSLIPELHC